MKFLKQFCIVLLFSFLGELCRYWIPYPIPASIYGMVLLFGAMALKIVRLEQVKDVSSFLVSVLPVLFVAPVVNLMDCWGQVKENWLALTVIVLVSTVVTFGVAGSVTQWLSRKQKRGEQH